MLELSKNKELQKNVEQYVRSIFDEEVPPYMLLRNLFLLKKSYELQLNQKQISELMINGICSNVVVNWILLPHKSYDVINKFPFFIPIESYCKKQEIYLLGKIQSRRHDIYIYIDNFLQKTWFFGSGLINSSKHMYRLTQA